MLVLAALLTALLLSMVTIRTITADDRLPSQVFLSSFATPPVAYVPRHALVEPAYTVAQEVSQMLHEAVQQIVDQIDHTLTMSNIDWAQVAEDSLTHSQHGIHVPTPAEFEAAEAAAKADLEAILGAPNIAAMVKAGQPAKRARVRVHALATDCGVDSKFLRGVLDHQFGIATKSPSSTVSAEQADEVREFFYTHTDV